MKSKKNISFSNATTLAIIFFSLKQHSTVFSKKQHNNQVHFEIQKSAKKSRTGQTMEAAGAVAIVTGTWLGIVSGIPLIVVGKSMDKHSHNIKVNFQVSRHSITHGQPYSGVTAKDNAITVKAGRKASQYVSHNFNNWIRGRQNTFDKKPQMLNFAVEGKLTLSGKDISGKIVKNTTVILDDMVLAQGHTAGGRNNWWIGGVIANCIVLGL